jgi:phage gp29-like protein
VPVRSGLARLAAWSWMFKAFTQRDWAIFTQTFGQPVRVGKYPAGTTEADKDTLFRAVANIAGDCAAIIPASMEIVFVESKNVGAGADLFEKRANYLDRQVSKAVLGQTATTDAIAGGHAVGQEHRQVQEDIERSDARSLAAILNRDLVRPWVQLEYGPQPKYPRLQIGRADQEDLTLLVSALEKLVPLGLRVQASEVREKFGLAEPEDGAELLVAAKLSLPPAVPGQDVVSALPAPGANAALHAVDDSQTAVRATDAVDRLADQTEHVVAPGTDAMIDAVHALVARSRSLPELLAGLKTLQLPKDRFAELMSMAMVMADLSGRAEIASS